MRLKLACGLVLASAFAGTASAQAPAAQPRPGSPTSPAQAQPVQPGAATTYPVQLYRLNDVSKNLNLNEKQVEQLNKLTDQSQARYRQNFEKLGTLAGAERGPRVQELDRQYTTEWLKSAREVLDEKQMARYQQLSYQYGGFDTFNDPDVNKRLNLTEEQRRNLRDSITWNEQQRREIDRLGATDREKATKLYGDYQKEYQIRFNKYLTPEQIKAWLDLTGEPYTFQPTFGGPNR